MIENLDTEIGEIFNALKETGLDNNTFVIFLSDNGPIGPGRAGVLKGGRVLFSKVATGFLRLYECQER